MTNFGFLLVLLVIYRVECSQEANNYILLIAPPERGHLNPILELAKQLTFNGTDNDTEILVSVPSYADVNV
ncbi:unnamed protein product, partial [Rotaria sordida]